MVCTGRKLPVLRKRKALSLENAASGAGTLPPAADPQNAACKGKSRDLHAGDVEKHPADEEAEVNKQNQFIPQKR